MAPVKKKMAISQETNLASVLKLYYARLLVATQPKLLGYMIRRANSMYSDYGCLGLRLLSASLHDYQNNTTDSLKDYFSVLKQVEYKVNKQYVAKGLSFRQGCAHQVEKIFISGFFYSGSGAVLHFLRDYSGTIQAFTHGEHRFIKFPGGIHDMSLRSVESNINPREKDLIDLCAHILGSKLIIEKGYNKWKVLNRNSKKVMQSDELLGYQLSMLRGAIDSIDRYYKNSLGWADYVRILENTFALSINQIGYENDKTHILLDQAINAWRIPRLSAHVSGSKFIVIFRDPRDQYIDTIRACQRTKRAKINVNEFISRYKSRRSSFEKFLGSRNSGSSPHRFICMGFEYFLTNHDEASAKIIEFCNLSNSTIDKKNYVLSDSLRNIGIHLQALESGEVDKKSILLIEMELKEYLAY